jgi:putative tryptophan/tyrosine transport system substrate-binding protein
MLRRREFVAGLGGAAVWPLMARAQQPDQGADQIRRIGVLMFGTPNDPISGALVAALRDGLDKLNWHDGRNLRVDVRIGSDVEAIRVAAADIVGLKPDVIVSRSTVVTRALQEQTTTIPIVFLGAGDPITSGLVASLARPGGNITGITDVYFTIGGKWLEMLKEAVPGLTRFGIVFNPDLTSATYFPSIEAAAAQYDVQAVMLPVRSGEDIERALDRFAAEPNGGLVMLPPAPVSAARELIRTIALKHRLPVIFQNKAYAIEGGMMSYGPDSEDMFRRGGPSYVDRILRGAKPAAMPVQFATRFELAFNLKTIKAMGFDIAPALFSRADAKID